jgi:hypothetical protein
MGGERRRGVGATLEQDTFYFAHWLQHCCEQNAKTFHFPNAIEKLILSTANNDEYYSSENYLSQHQRATVRSYTGA